MKTMLIVDDSIFARSLIKIMIRDINIKVVGEAHNGRIGVEKYKELKPDIVTMDIAMDELTGLEALKEIMAYDPGATVIMISSIAGQEAFIVEATKAGAVKLFVKPVKKSQFVSYLNELIMK